MMIGIGAFIVIIIAIAIWSKEKGRRHDSLFNVCKFGFFNCLRDDCDCSKCNVPKRYQNSNIRDSKDLRIG